MYNQIRYIDFFITEQLVLLNSILYMSQQHQISIPSFLIKLKDIMGSDGFPHIIRWDKSGEAIQIVCINALEEVVLPLYFRHSKYSSFVRQLNMYGFHKRKAEKNIASCFFNPYFSKSNIIFSAMSKKYKKEIKEQTKDRNEQIVQHKQQLHHEYSTQHQQIVQKCCQLNKPSVDGQFQQCWHLAKQKVCPEVNELIEELSQRVSPFAKQIDWINCRQLELVLRQPKFQKVNSAALAVLNFDVDQLFSFVHIPLGSVFSDKMELIL